MRLESSSNFGGGLKGRKMIGGFAQDLGGGSIHHAPGRTATVIADYMGLAISFTANSLSIGARAHQIILLIRRADFGFSKLFIYKCVEMHIWLARIKRGMYVH